MVKDQLRRIQRLASADTRSCATRLCVKLVQIHPCIYLQYVCQSTLSCSSLSDQMIFDLSRIPARRSPAAQRASRSTRSRNRQTAQQRTQPQNQPAASQLAPRAGAIHSNRQLRIVAQLVLRLIHALPRRALAAQNLKHVSHAAAAALATRRRSERLTDAFTKLLLPGTKMRFASACVISRNRLL